MKKSIYYRFPCIAILMLIYLNLTSCSYQHWALKEIEQVNSVPDSTIVKSFKEAILKQPLKLNAGSEISVEITAEDPIIQIGDSRLLFKLFSFNTENKGPFTLKIVSEEIEKEQLRGAFSGIRELGIFLPSVFILDANGKVITDSLSSLKFEDNLVFSSFQLEALVENELPGKGNYFILLTSKSEKLGTEVDASLWSFVSIDEMLDDDDSRRYSSLTGEFEILLMFH